MLQQASISRVPAHHAEVLPVCILTLLESSISLTSPPGGEASCDSAFHVSTDTCVQVGCSANDVRVPLVTYYQGVPSNKHLYHLQAGLQITFCGVSTGFTDASHPTTPC